jgi:hypothetical protein
VDLNDPNLDPAVQQEFRNREQARAQASMVRREQDPLGTIGDAQDAKLLSMIESIGQLDMDEQGGWDFHGISSGAVFFRRMKEHFRGMMGPPTGKAPFLPRPERPPGLISLDSPQSAASSPFDSATSSIPELPPKEVARSLCYYSLHCATCLTRIVHVPSFYEMFEKVYEKPTENLTGEETKFLGLFFAVIALGCMYSPLDESMPESMAHKEAMEQGQVFPTH